MKKYFLLVVTTLLMACQDTLPPTEESNEYPTTRAIVDINRVSTSNPDLLDNWENVGTIVLNTIGNSGIQKKVTPPWQDGTSTLLTNKFRKDIKKEDGWKMLFHTFKEVGLDEKQNYMCFYNMFTGYLKFFYYYEGEQKSQGTQWYMRTANGEKTRLFNLANYITKTDTAQCEYSAILVSNLTGDPTNGITPGWNGFEFEVPYCTDYRNIDFTIGAYDKNITTYNFLGKEEASIVGTITGISTSTSRNSITTTLTTTTTINGEDAKKYIENLDKRAELSTKMDSLIKASTNGNHIQLSVQEPIKPLDEPLPPLHLLLPPLLPKKI